MTRLLATAALLILGALLACSSPDPTPAPTAPPTPVPPTATAEPTPTLGQTAPSETPETTLAPSAQQQPGSQPQTTPAPDTGETPEAESTTEPGNRLQPLPVQGRTDLQGELSQAELDCIGDGADRIAGAITGRSPLQATDEEKLHLLECLSDETMARLFIANFVPSGQTMGEETSDCATLAFEVIDPRETMTSGARNDFTGAMAAGMAMMMITAYCMNDEEFAANAPLLDLAEEDRTQVRCITGELGGPKELAEAMMTAQYGSPEAITAAAEACGIDTGPIPAPAPEQPNTGEDPGQSQRPWSQPEGTPGKTGMTRPPEPATASAHASVPTAEGTSLPGSRHGTQ